MNLKPLLLTTLACLLTFSQITDPATVTQPRSSAAFAPVPLPGNGRLKYHPEKTTDVDKLKQSDWYAAAMKSMQEGEYHFNKVGDTYSTPNRKNNLRFFYDENGFTVQPRTTRIPVGDYDITTLPDQMQYKTLPDWKIAFKLDKKQVGKGTWDIAGSKAEYKTGNVTVQYINNTEGMRQNFIVQKPLSEDDDLKLNFSVETTLEQRLSSDRLQFVHEQSGVVLNYEQLKVWDATGKILAADFEKNNGNYAIHVHTAGAAYPITIDPISTTAAAMVESNQAGATMGISVASAGDVNGDGYNDLVVGAYGYDNGEHDEGAAFVYHGSATGINIAAATMMESNQANSGMGQSVASAGDVNGDGYSDIILGAYGYGNGQRAEGAAFVYHGSGTGINTTAAIIESNQVNVFMGRSVASAGDVNGDGYSDIIIGADGYDNGQLTEGAAFVYYGNAANTSNRNNLNLYNVDLTTPISSSNFSLASFGAGLHAKSFLGRSKGKLVWETKISYEPYSGTPITNSVLYTSRQSSFTDLTTTGTELKNLVAKQTGKYTKVRARVQYDPVTAITGQMYGPWRYVPSLTAGTSGGALPVDLISFKVAWQEQGQTARVIFVTENASEMCCYEIEKSDNGFHFNVIGHLDAINVAELHTYNFIDLQATGKKQYYRLKTIHATGETDYSRIVLLQDKTVTEILVFPNPTADVLQLQLNKAYSNIQVQIVNSVGRVVKQLTASSDANQTIKIPVSGLMTGSYFLYLQTGGEKQALQFIKE